MDLSRGELVEQLATAFGNLLDLYRESERVNAELYLSNQRSEAGKACGEVPFCPNCRSSQLRCARCNYPIR
jgi:hypothetical protein